MNINYFLLFLIEIAVVFIIPIIDCLFRFMKYNKKHNDWTDNLKIVNGL